MPDLDSDFKRYFPNIEFSLNELQKQTINSVINDGNTLCIMATGGLSFRLFYKRIPYFLDTVYGADNWPHILALTATLNPKELDDICAAFRIAIDGNMVRSKSEVIICNLFANNGIDYNYEELLEYEPGKFINPDCCF